MEYPEVEEKESYFSLKNTDFIINIDNTGKILSWQVKNKGITLISTASFEDKLSIETEEPFASSTSSSAIFERDFENGQIKKVFNIREKSLVVDIYFITLKPMSIDFGFELKFNNWMDYMMISKDRFELKESIEQQAKDFLLVNEKQDIYLGCIFKEEANLKAEPTNNLLNISLTNTLELTENDMFMLSYTFALV
ncbi:hypothetical protein [Hippea alviniae]|uniref:hypothetical protein n=1 Tax=Hippea alviniae TaxID=1279027 RepID=UPI0003B5613E|nr:hypothetical protein [Hippea alviniae]